MPYRKKNELRKFGSEEDNESINCCQLDTHKKLIRKRNAHTYTNAPDDIFAKRTCTDIFCLFFFVAALIGWIVISIIVFKNGGPAKILAPVDSNNRRCGYDEGVEKQPYLFFFDITKCLLPRANIFRCDTQKVCVSKCPTTNFSASYYLQQKMPLWSIKEKLICIDDFAKDKQINSYDDVRRGIRDGVCADWYMESESMTGRCISRILLLKQNSLSNRTNNSQSHSSGAQIMLNSALSFVLNFVTVDVNVYQSNFKELPKLRAARVCLPRYLSKPFQYDTYASVNFPKVYSEERNEVKLWEEFIQQVGEYILKTWPWLVAFTCLAMFFSIIYIIVMKWITGVMVWLSLVALICLLSVSSFYSWENYSEVKSKKKELSQPLSVMSAAMQNFRANLNLLGDDLLKHEYTWLAIFVLSVASLVIIVIILLFLRGRIILAIQLIKEGSKAISHAWTSLIFPIFPWALYMLVFVQGGIIFSYLLGKKVPVYHVTGLNGSNCLCTNGYKEGNICNTETFKNYCHDFYGNPCLSASCSFSSSESENITIYLHIFNIFMMLWSLYFISGFSQMSLAMAFATYYWNAKKKLPTCIMGMSVVRVISFHLGTVAFGSLLLAFLGWLRIMVEFLSRYARKGDNPVLKLLRCCCGYLLKILCGILRILTRNAYIICAIRGSNYCASAKHAFDLIIRNIVNVSVLDGVTAFIFFLMKLFITLLMGVISYYFFSTPIPDVKNLSEENIQFHYFFVPVILICLITYIISSLFFGIYSEAVNTIFLCALEDMELNDGSPEKPYAMSKSLSHILNVKNKKSKTIS